MIAIQKNIVQQYHRPLFYAAWLAILIIQSLTTELFDDEAYYWVYSRFLDWGYYDHPPMIAVLIKAGYAIFPNALGVRILSAVLTTGALFIAETLLAKKNSVLFYAICCSLVIAQIGGMMAVPDSPLMFFVALFFYGYHRFTQKMNFANTVFVGICMALMLYTKYQAVLIILFTSLSNLTLFKKYQSYVAILIVILLFIPHLSWQAAHDFPSVQFHLFERNSQKYNFFNTIDYIVGQVLLAGPVTGWLLMWAAIKYKPVSATERALKYSLIGIYLFFLVSTLKGKAEANWTISAFIGLIILSHGYLAENERLKRILYKTVPLSLVIVIAGRGIMMIDLPPAWWIFKDEFHGNAINTAEIRQRSADLPVVFINSYQKPSKYWYYSGDTAFSLNTPKYRRNNFNFWPVEDSLFGRDAYVIGDYKDSLFTEPFTSLRLNTSAGIGVSNYYSFSRVLLHDVTVVPRDSSKCSISFSSTSPETYLPLFQQSPYDTAQVYMAVFQGDSLLKYHPLNMVVRDITMADQHHIVSTDPQLPMGKYRCRLAVSSCVPGHPSLNSTSFTISIK